MDLTDTTQWPDAALSELIRQVHAEQQRRTILMVAAAQVTQQQADYLEARDRTGQYATGSSPAVPTWVQPTGAHDAYPEGRAVSHSGKVWDSLVPNNVWEPGVSGWRARAATPSTPSDWVQPTGAHDAYSYGDKVSHSGTIWQSTNPGLHTNTWEPGVYGWVQVAS